MLAGIKTGKKKKKQKTLKEPPPRAGASEAKASLEAEESSSSQAAAAGDGSSNTKRSTTMNASIAEQLRQSLAAGTAPPISGAASTAKTSTSPSTDAVWKDLERRGRIQPGRVAADASRDAVVVGPAPPLAAAATAAAANDADLSIQQMIKQEKMQTMSWQEHEMRDVLRTGKHKKRKFKKQVDSDEDEQQQIQRLERITTHHQTSGGNNDNNKALARESSRQVALQDKQTKITSKCWWWIESSQFARHRLLALGNYVSLVMAPPNMSLIAGQHFYLVPLSHAESLTACDDDVWNEIVRFQSSLRALFAKQDKAVLFWETVLPSASFWQTKLEAVAIPRKQWRDAPLVFKSALSEQAQEWGTHQSLMKVTKGLRRTVPKNFDYFYVEYGENEGYAQMIETESFPKDFGVDTVAGMLEMDPVRFRRREKTMPEQERQCILQFLEKWKAFDWTLQLDG